MEYLLSSPSSLFFLDGYGIAVIVFLALSLVFGILVTKLVKRRSTNRNARVLGKGLPLFFIGTILAVQSIDGNSSLGSVSLVYQFGFWAGAIIPIGLAISLILTGVFYGKKLNKMTLLTLPDFYYRRYGFGAEGISSLLMIISFIVLVAGNFASTGFILSSTLHIDFFWAMLFGAIIVLVYAFAGGLFSSAYTDVFYIYVAIFAFWAAFIFFAAGGTGVNFGTILGSSASATSPPSPAYLDLSGLTSREHGALINWGGLMAVGLGNLVSLDFMERVFSVKDQRVVKRGAFMGAGLTLLTVIPVAMLGIVALYFLPKLSDPFLAYPELALHHVPFPIGAALLMGVLGASMSTASGGLLAVSSVVSRNIIQRDILRRWLKRTVGLEDKKLLLVARLLTGPIMVSAFVLGYLLPQPGVFLILAFDIVFAGAWAPLTLGLFWKKANTPAAITSLIVGSALRLLMVYVIPVQYAGLDTIIPPVVSFALFVIVALTTYRKHPGRHSVVDYAPPQEDVIRGEDLKRYVSASGGIEEEFLVRTQEERAKEKEKPRIFSISYLLSASKSRYVVIGIIGAVASVFVLSLVFAYGVISHDTVYIVVSESMIPNLNVGDLLIVRHGDSFSSFGTLKVGDIILFFTPGRSLEGQHLVVVHRVAEVKNDINTQGDYVRVIRTKGDHNPDSIPLLDFPITQKDYIGKEVFDFPRIGLIRVIEFRSLHR